MNGQPEQAPREAAIELDFPQVAELQDQLLAASTDLERLTTLLGDAAEQLLGGFGAANARLDAHFQRASGPSPATLEATERTLSEVRDELHGAVTALQFQDMASQLILHSVRRIRAVADFLGSRVDDGEGTGPAIELVTRACPVAQREMDAGSIELF